ncbi:unnamed protein product [Rotaria sordida]|uniref:Integrase catalytic domain-containing protein n=1 Tax=Rotaria sordida TaxID=392033 RepID=A0A814XAL5_9BILA|nr:unnamed protein product [Rotaria sordida]
MSVNNDNVETSFYSGSPISVHDACDRLIRLVNLLGLYKAKTSLLLKELRFFFPSDCRLPKTIVTLFKMTNNNYHPEASIRCVECSQILTQSNEEDGLIFCIHNEIITDQENNFTTNILNSYFKLIGIKHILICAYHPWSSGVIERFNHLFGGMIAKHVTDNTINKWTQYVDRALFVCRIR